MSQTILPTSFNQTLDYAVGAIVFTAGAITLTITYLALSALGISLGTALLGALIIIPCIGAIMSIHESNDEPAPPLRRDSLCIGAIMSIHESNDEPAPPLRRDSLSRQNTLEGIPSDESKEDDSIFDSYDYDGILEPENNPHARASSPVRRPDGSIDDGSGIGIWLQYQPTSPTSCVTSKEHPDLGKTIGRFDYDPDTFEPHLRPPGRLTHTVY